MIPRNFKRSVVSISLSLFSSTIFFSCAHDFANEFEGDGDPIVETGADCAASESNSIPDTEQQALTVSSKDSSLICKVFSALPYCRNKVSLGVSSFAAPKCQAKTNYCRLDENGKPISEDFITVAGDDKYTGLIGGCIHRPIREVFATLVNFGAMVPDPVDRFVPTQRKDLEDPAKQMIYVVDLRNIKGSIIGDIKWDVQYRYKVSKGSYHAPRQIAVNYQRVWGSSFVELIKGGYVLDRVSDTVTSFVMSQVVKTAQYSQSDMARDLKTDLRKVRTADPNWTNLPEHGPALTLDFSNVRM